MDEPEFEVVKIMFPGLICCFLFRRLPNAFVTLTGLILKNVNVAL
jgi:hypothetical protein